MDKKYTILIIDDKKENLKYLNEILKDENYIIKATTDPIFGIESAKISLPDLVLLDIKMPNINGFDICKLFKKENILKNIPIIFISALDDIDIKVKAFEEGGVDYITKPFEKEEVIARIKTQLKILNKNQTILNLLKQQNFFLNKIIHEMNTPLSVIQLNVDNLEKEIGPKKQFEAIKASSKSLSSVYNDLYYLIKQGSSDTSATTIDLIAFLSSRVSFFDEIAKTKNIHLDLEIGFDFSIIINEYEFERIIDNSLSNAIKYSHQDTIVSLIINKENENFYLEVINEGIKIKDTKTIFDKYYQEKEKNIGLGLGLNIVKSICDKHKIQIEVISDNKTSFKYIFPKNIVKVIP